MSTQFDDEIDLGIKQLSGALEAQDTGPRTDAIYTAMDFCKAWPVARAVLDMIGKAVPVVGSIAVSIIIKIGDGVYASKGCQPTIVSG